MTGRRVAGLFAVLVVSLSFAGSNVVAPFSAMAPGEDFAPWQLETISGRKPASFTVTADGHIAADADAAVASLYLPLDDLVLEQPVLRWRWQLEQAVPDSALNDQSVDDFPARVYVMFDYDLGQLPFVQRWQLRLARLVYGSWVPVAALCYVPADTEAPGTIAPNAYSDRIRMIVVDTATVDGQWRSFERDVAADYAAAFDEPLPPIRGVAIAIDTDDTGGRARARFGDIVLE